MFPTAFRQWTASAENGNVQDVPVPGLREALADAGLSSFGIAIEHWCRKNGAAFLSELSDEVENICSYLGPPGSEGLAPELRKRLVRALSSQSTSELKHRCATQDSIESFIADIRAKMSAAKLAECGTDHRFSGETDEHRVGLVPGLRKAFEDAELSHLSDKAEAWCHDNGAAYLQEMLDYFDDLCEDLIPQASGRLDPRACERLKRTLSSQVALDTGKLLLGHVTCKAQTW
jgi:hypothetical protein